MKPLISTASSCLLLLSGVFASAQDTLRHQDLAGWWSAEPVHGGESSPLRLQFLEKEGRQVAQLSIPAIGAYEIDLGDVVIQGNRIDTKGLSFPLSWSPAGTLSGALPADAAPIYQIAVEFRRGAPFERPSANVWQAARPEILWSLDTGGSPVWAGIERDAGTGVLFVANEAGVLHAISGAGKLLWKFDSGRPVRAQPRVIAGFVYLHSDSGFVYKLDARSGAESWRARVGAGSEPRLPTDAKGTRWDRYGSSVAAGAAYLYVASRDKHLYALDPKTGREVWRVPAGDIMTATPALHGGNVIFAAYDGQVRAVSARDGSPRWTYDAKLAVPGDLTVSGDRLLLGSRSYDLIALDAATGRQLWKRYYWFSWIESPPLVHDGVVYTGSSDATNVYAIDLADGRLRWKTAVPGFSWQRVAVDDEWLVAGTTGSGPFPGARAGALVAMDRATGVIRWIHLDPPAAATPSWGFGASPVMSGGVVFAADLTGKVYAFRL